MIISFKMLLVENHENPKGNKTVVCSAETGFLVENHENPKGNKTTKAS